MVSHSRSRSAFIFFVFLLALIAVVPLSFAQDLSDFGLDADDAALFTSVDVGDSFGFEMNIDLVLSAEGENVTADIDASGVFDAINEVLDATVTVTADDSGDVTNFDAQIRIVDEILYINATDPVSGAASGWMGVPLEQVLGAAEGAVPVPLDPSSLGGGGGDLDQLLPLFDALDALDPTEFVSITRTGDENIGGANTGHFFIDIMIANIFSSDSFGELIFALLNAVPAEALGGAGLPLGDLGDTSAQELQFFGAILGALFQDTDFGIDLFIGTDDNLLRRLAVDLNLNLDLAGLGQTGPPVVVDVNFGLTMTGVNERYSVAAPEGAVIDDGSGFFSDALGNLAGGGDAGGGSTTGGGTVATGGETLSQGVPAVVTLVGDGSSTDLTYIASGPSRIDVSARSVSAGGVDTTLEIVDANGNRIAFNDDHGSDRSDLGGVDSALSNVELPGAGTYFVRINSFTGLDAGDVEVVLTATGGGDGGTTAGEAVVIVDQLAEGGRSSHDFSFSSGEVVTITVKAVSSGFDPKAALRDASGTLLIENDDHSDIDPELQSTDSRIEKFVIPAAGVFTVEITEFFGNAGSFELTVEREGGGVASSAPINGSLTTGGNFIQTIDLNAGEIVTITVRDTSDSLDPQVGLTSADGVQVAFNDDHGSGDASLDVFDSRLEYSVPTSGTYTIEVRDFSSGAGNFEMTIARR